MLFWLAALVLSGLTPACDCSQARSKPWRHVEDPAPGSSAPSSTVLAAEAERARLLRERADTLRIQLDADPVHLDPMAAPTVWTDRVALGPVFETLLRCAAGPRGTEYQPGLAARWSIEQGGRVIALELQPEVRFHDGSRLSSVDVQYSLDRARSGRPDVDHLRRFLADVSAVELAGPATVRLWLHRPNGLALRGLCAVPILPASVYQGRAVARRGPVVGSGPYRLASFDDAGVRLVRNPTYWGPPPAIARIEFVREADDARALSLARGGELDVVPAVLAQHLGVAAEPAVTRRLAEVALEPVAFDYLALASDRPPLDDVRVRRALSLAIDRDALADKLHGALARPVVAPVWPGGPASGPAAQVPAHDLAAAGRLLAEAGWIDRDGDGVRDRGGARLGLVALVSDEPSPVRDAVLAALRGLGIFVEERVGSPAVLLNRLQGGQFQLAFVTWRGPADGELAALVGSGGRQNFGRFRDPATDALLDAMRATFDPAERAAHAGRLGAHLAEALPLIPLTRAAPRALVHRRVRGLAVWNGWLVLDRLSLAPDDDGE